MEQPWCNDGERSFPGRRLSPPLLLVALLGLGLTGCLACRSRTTADASGPSGRAPSGSRPCPEDEAAPPLLPDQHPFHSLPEFWLARGPAPEATRVRLEAILEHNRRVHALREEGWPSGRWELQDLPFSPERVRARLRTRLLSLRKGAEAGKWLLLNGGPPTALLAALERAVDKAQPADELRVLHRSAALRCFPTDEGLYDKPWQSAFDLMQCAQLRFGEMVRVGAKGERFWYVWSPYAEGWIAPEALTPVLGEDEARSYHEPARFVVAQADRVPLWTDRQGGTILGEVRLGGRLPLLGEEEGLLRVVAPGPAGLRTAWVRRADAVSVGFPVLSFDRLVARAFSLLNSPYGWGDVGDNRDCSRLIMDLFGAFGVELPRNTWHQAQAGARRVEVGSMDEPAKARAIQEAASRGIVLLHMPGHIMLYLGRDGDRLFAFHQFSGYLVPCEGGGETMKRVNRAVVTSLELGRGSSRKSFLQRITRLVVF